MLWILQDSAPTLDFDWLNAGDTAGPSMMGTEYNIDLTLPVDSANRPPAFIAPSRPASPPIDVAEEDKWRERCLTGETVFADYVAATNYQPKRPFVLGSSGKLSEVQADPALDPVLERWSWYWLDHAAYERVKSSLSESRSSL
jgi:hypothetical protein